MNWKWMHVLAAVFFEVCWVTGLKHAASLLEWFGTVAAIGISFYFLVTAARFLPVGTVYAVFVGLGTAGIVLLEMVFFGEPVEGLKIFFMLVLLTGVMGLKWVTDVEPEAGGEQ